MKATVILIGLLAMALLSLLGDPAVAAAGHGSKVFEPAWMTVSGAALIALGSAVRRYIP